MNGNRNVRLTTIFLLIIFLPMMTGCALPWVKISEVPIKPATQYKFCFEQEGLVIAVDPFFEEERLKTFFGTDLLKHGILPILVVTENHDPKSGYLLEKKAFSLAMKVQQQADTKEGIDPSLPKSTRVNPLQSGPVAVLGLATAVLAPGLVLLSLPVLVPVDMHAKKIEGDIRKINENLNNKGFVDRTIFPGESHSGFVYFQVQDTETVKNVSIMLIKAKGIVSDKELDFVLKIKD